MPQVQPLRLGVNVDHVATVRNARAIDKPDPVRAALLAIEAGADGITAHLREAARLVDLLHEQLRRKPLRRRVVDVPAHVEPA